MANCIPKLSNPTTNIIPITGTSSYVGSILNYFDRKYYKFVSDRIQDVTFYFNFTGNIVSVEVTYYKLINGTISQVGQSILNDNTSTSVLSIDIGEYYICIASYYPTTYSIRLDYIAFNGILIENINFYSGDNFQNVFASIPSDCNTTVAYKLIDGNLPGGLYFRSDGIIEGIIEEQDCYSNKPFPSFTLYVDDEDISEEAEAYPTTIDYPITIRAYFLNSPEVYADRNFKICVHNNWDFDRQEYLDNFEKFEQPVFINIINRNSVENYLEIPIIEEKFDTCGCESLYSEEIIQVNDLEEFCPPCTELFEPVYNNVTADCICEEESTEGLIKVNIETLCELSCNPVEPLLLEIVELCPCNIETPIITDEGIEVFEDIPNFKLYSFINRMNTEKVCKGPLVQEYKEESVIIPPLKKEDINNEICGC